MLNEKELVCLRARTQSGIQLGRVRGVAIESTTHMVTHYIVTRGFFDAQRLRIHRDQIVHITHSELIVKDASVFEGTQEKSISESRSDGAVAPVVIQNDLG